jgi:hypothetical protein
VDEATRTAALQRLDALAGEWTIEARFSFAPDPTGGRVTFEWALGRQFLVERSEADHPDAPDSLAIISVDETGDGDRYVQHYFDSRGVVRLYRMTLRDGLWTLVRDTPDFSPLSFAQRYTGKVAPDGRSVTGRWEISHDDGATWEVDFELDYAKVA